MIYSRTIIAFIFCVLLLTLSDVEDKSELAEGFINYVGTTDVSTTPNMGGMLLLLVIAIMIAGQIWYPKQK